MTRGESESFEETRERLLLAALPNVAFDGWSRRAILSGAADLGLEPAEALNAFPGGETELIAYFSAWADRRMIEGLEAIELDKLRISERVAMAVRLRLEALEPHQEAVRRGMSLFALPVYAPLALNCLYRTVDAIWYAVGDTATDYNFYTKRVMLSSVYSSTLLYWLNDTSEEHEDTWDFLERRLAQMIKLGGSLGRAMNSCMDLPDRLAGMLPRARMR